MRSRIRIVLAAASMLFTLVPVAARAAYHLRDDATGGDCALIGTWEGATRTCTLQQDLVFDVSGGEAGIFVESSGLVLDGAGHLLTGAGTTNYAVAAVQTTFLISGGTIRNLVIDGFPVGVNLDNAERDFIVERNVIRNSSWVAVWITGAAQSGMVISGNRIANAYIGIRTQGTSDSVVQGNEVDFREEGIQILSSHRNIVAGNSVSQATGFTGNGLYLWASDDNVIRDNTIQGSRVAIHIAGNRNAAFHNDVFGIATILPDYFGEVWSGSVLAYDPPVGGNYWSGHPCTDANRDGFCDEPMTRPSTSYFDTTDPYPWTVPGGWKDADGDGSVRALDCNDLEATVHPGAPEVKGDGVDQDCNGYDLTTYVTKAHYTVADSSLRIEATSGLGAAGALTVEGFGPMTWKSNQAQWLFLAGPITNPGQVTVCSVEGCTSSPVLEQ